MMMQTRRVFVTFLDNGITWYQMLKKNLEERQESVLAIVKNGRTGSGTAARGNSLDDIAGVPSASADASGFPPCRSTAPEISTIYTARKMKALARMISRCCICIGDLYRYKMPEVMEQEVQTCREKAYQSYMESARKSSWMGNSYNQLAVIHGMLDEDVYAAYLYLRAITAAEPFTVARSNLDMLLGKVQNEKSMIHRLSGSILTPKAGRKGQEEKNQLGKKGLNTVERMAGQRYMLLLSQICNGIDVDSIPRLLDQGSHDIEEYLNRKLQKIKKLVATSKPVFGKARRPVNADLKSYRAYDFQMPKLPMVVSSSLLLIIKGRLGHQESGGSTARNISAKSYGNLIVLDLAFRLARVVGRSQHVMTVDENNVGLDAICSEFLFPLLLCLSFVHENLQNQGDTFFSTIMDVCGLLEKNSKIVDKFFKKLWQSLASCTDVLRPVALKIQEAGIQGKHLSQSGLVVGSSILQDLADLPEKRKIDWILENNIVSEQPKQRKSKSKKNQRVQNLHVMTKRVLFGTWSLLENLTMVIRNDEEFPSLRKYRHFLVQLDQSVSPKEECKETPAMCQRVEKDKEGNSSPIMEDGEVEDEHIVYAPRQSTKKLGIRVGDQNTRMHRPLPDLMEIEMHEEEDEDGAGRLAHEMATEVLLMDEIGPSYDKEAFEEDGLGKRYDILATDADWAPSFGFQEFIIQRQGSPSLDEYKR